jgi:hypothetical protein
MAVSLMISLVGMGELDLSQSHIKTHLSMLMQNRLTSMKMMLKSGSRSSLKLFMTGRITKRSIMSN